ncbi:MAG: monophosphatase [Solirubrobacteraceae bacterium]|nr:monophosphatase [Solirubrobacteraceae bacterium]
MGRPPPAGVLSAELLDVAEAAARAAGELLLEQFKSRDELVISAKSTPTDLVSEADHAAERLIRGILHERVPDDGIVGEEGDDIVSRSGRRWIVDPLDGTVNFLFGNPQWCVSVACDDEVGVIYDPLRDELFAGGEGLPTTLGGEAVVLEDRTDLATALVATGFGYDAQQRGEQGTLAASVLPRCRDLRRAGSAALDLAWTAVGRVDAFYEHGVQRWDIAAGVLLCAGAGLDVRPLRARGRLPAGVMAAPSAIADELAALVD